jgi:hypothetical protein
MSVICPAELQVRMGRLKRAFEGRERSQQQRLSLVVALALDEQGRMVVEGGGDVVVLWAERVLEHCQRVLEQGLRVLVASEGVEDGGAVGRDVDVVGPERARADLDGARAGGSAAS